MAKAQAGKTYALIQDGKAHKIFNMAELPEWHDGLKVVDVTGNVPNEGDDYDGTVFTSPVIKVDPRKAKRDALKARRAGQVTRQEFNNLLDVLGL